MPSAILSNIEPTSGTYSNIKFYEKDGVAYVAPLRQVKDTRKLTPTVEDLTPSDPVTIEKVIEKIEIYGGCVVRDFISTGLSDKIMEDLAPHFETKDWNGSFFPKETTRVPSVMTKSMVALDNLLLHPFVQGVAKKFVSKRNVFILGEEYVEAYSAPQLNAAVTINVGPGAKDQNLHRDDIIHHNIRQYREKYEYGSETAVGFVVAHTKTTKSNGATRFIPGSHLWDHFRVPHNEEAVYAELEKGDAFFMLASCYHGGSANTTQEHRAQTIFFLTQGTCRPEENIMLETSIEFFKSLSEEQLRALGVGASYPLLGFIRDISDPVHILKPETKNKNDDIFENTYRIGSLY